MRQETKELILYIAVVKVLIILIGLFAYHLVLFGDFFYKNNYRFAERQDRFLDLWDGWDGQWYLKIATEGYRPNSLEKTDIQSRAFFPLYPTLMKIIGFITGNALAGLLISYAASIIALVMLYYLVRLDFPGDAQRTFLYVLLFPTAMFFSAVYTEGLFLLCAVLAFYFARKQQWWYAGFAGAFAALTKVYGVFLIIPLLLEYLQSKRHSRQDTTGHYALPLIPLAFVLHLLYLKIITGDWLAFLRAQGIWQKGSFAFSKYLTDLAWHGFKDSAIDLAVTVLFLVLLYFCFKRLRPSYAAYAAIVLFIPILSGDLMSMSRHVLMSFPSFMILAQWGRKEKIHYMILLLFTMFLAFFTALFVNNYWVA